mgnify:CR=1 FL=1
MARLSPSIRYAQSSHTTLIPKCLVYSKKILVENQRVLVARTLIDTDDWTKGGPISLFNLNVVPKEIKATNLPINMRIVKLIMEYFRIN